MFCEIFCEPHIVALICWLSFGYNLTKYIFFTFSSTGCKGFAWETISCSEIYHRASYGRLGWCEDCLYFLTVEHFWRILNKALERSTFGEGSGETSVVMQHQRSLGAV